MSYATKLTASSVFNVLAEEYYDPVLHPTCANFREASIGIISKFLNNSESYICDVGCGKSVVAEILSSRNWGVPRLFLSDSSAAMLEHSRVWDRSNTQLVLADADKLPVPNATFNILVASLGDPFNGEGFWCEANRVISPNGKVIFTTPSYEWAKAFRQNMPENLSRQAEFLLRDGSRKWIPSIIRSESDQVDIINGAGLSLIGIEHVSLGDLTQQIVSPKLRVLDENTPFLTAYVATRVAET